MTSLDAVVVGSAVRDEYYTLSNLPAPDGGSFVRDRETAVGGVGANVAVALSRLGRNVGLIARVGEPDAPTIESHLAGEGVDIDRLRRGDEEPTYSIVLRDGEGERMVVTGGESTRSLTLEAADIEYCRRAEVVFTSGYVPDAAVRRLLDADIPPLAFDLPGPLRELRDRGTEPRTVDRAVRSAALFIAGRVAIRDYLGCEPADIVELRAQGGERAALTDGEAGAHLLDADRSHAVQPFDVDAVDTTGAGDAFTAGLIDAWLLDGRPAAASGRWAAAVAALNCRDRTAQGGLPMRERVESFIEGRR